MDSILSNAFGQDATHLATAEKQLLLSRLLSRLAHEIRNPLSSLDIHVQLLEEDVSRAGQELREKTSARFEIIHGELHRLENTVKHFLRLASSSELELEQIELERLAGHIIALLRPEASERNISMDLELAEGMPPVLADLGQLTQALLNLVINAIQAVGHNGMVGIRVKGVPGETLVIEVIDSGPGVPEEKRATIFEPFFTTKPEGSGLGLWIAHQVSAAHGGTISVGSRPEGGTVFALRLPYRRPESGEFE